MPPKTIWDVTFAAKDLFFDRQRVIERINKQRYRAMFRLGGNVRQRARKSIKKKNLGRAYKKYDRQQREYERGKRSKPPDSIHSKPGDPPYSWQESEPNIRTILYSYDPSTDTVVIGPVILERSKTNPTVPHGLEFGAPVTVQEYRFEGTRKWVRGKIDWRRGALRHRKIAEKRTRTTRSAARPFMRPALEKEAPKFPELF